MNTQVSRMNGNCGMYTQHGKRDAKTNISNIFGSYIANSRTVPGVKQFTPKEEEVLNDIMDELSAYFEQA